jgi:carbonic anhydrase/acetyltransferase-like protein (isoleucine patch superfamily)
MIRSLGGKVPRIHPSAYISEAAYVAGDVEIGENSSVWPGAVIRGDFGKITIGKNTHIEDNCVLHTGDELHIGDNNIIGHAVTAHCKKIGNNCMIGIGAMLLQGAEIEDGSFIAAGSLVAPNVRVPSKSLYMGNPARFKEQLTDDKIAMVSAGAEFYCAMAKKYKDLGY